MVDKKKKEEVTPLLGTPAPTANDPNKVNKGVRFNPDNTVDVTNPTEGGGSTTQRLTRQEYQQFLASQGSESAARAQSGKPAINSEALLSAKEAAKSKTTGAESALAGQQSQELEALKNEFLNATPEKQQQLQTQFGIQTIARALGKLTPNLVEGAQQGPGQAVAGALQDVGNIAQATANIALPVIAAGAAAPVFGAAALTARTATAGKIFTKLASVKGVTKSIGLFLLGGGVAQGANFLTTGRADELEGDMNDLGSSTSDIVKDVRAGADPIEAIETMRIIEEEIRALSNEMNRAVNSPINIKDKLKGRDVQETTYNTLNKVIRRRQALERYLLSGDRDALAVYSEVGV